jgi:hypothetical protein
MKSLRKASALAVLVGLSQLTCHQVILTAPPGSMMDCSVNPPFIAANGDIAVVSVIIFDPTGFPVADGTVVQFFATLGKIPEQAKTNDGVARVNFMSDSRSGKATIRAFSGGAVSAPGTTQTTGTTVRTAPPDGSDASSFAAGLSGSASGILANCSDLTVDIGSGRPSRVTVVTANPQRLTGGAKTSEITAFVVDSFGNPVTNVPVIFKSENARLGEMESGGSPRYTDNDGRAVDVFRTKFTPADGPASAKIEVFLPNLSGAAGSVTVFIN